MSENINIQQHRRRRHFIDTMLQGRLIQALLVFEILLFSAGLWFIYLRTQAAIDAQLYRIHQVSSDSLPVLLNSVVVAAGFIILLNVVVLWGVKLIWQGKLNNILAKLRNIIQSGKSLDLRVQRDLLDVNEHPVVITARAWKQHEHMRCQTLRAHIKVLPGETSQLNEMQLNHLKHTLLQIRHSLTPDQFN